MRPPKSDPKALKKAKQSSDYETFVLVVSNLSKIRAYFVGVPAKRGSGPRRFIEEFPVVRGLWWGLELCGIVVGVSLG